MKPIFDYKTLDIDGNLHVYQASTGAYMVCRKTVDGLWVTIIYDREWRETARLAPANDACHRANLKNVAGGAVLELDAVPTCGAATILGLASQTVRNQIGSGALEAIKLGRDHLVTVSSIGKYEDIRLGRPGRKATTDHIFIIRGDVFLALRTTLVV